MRSESEIKELILDFAKRDERIRAVLLNGSRADPAAKADLLQDFDIVFIVDNLESFTRDHSWTDFLGEKIISQWPDEMCFGNDDRTPGFHYLMLFDDWNRIDLTLFPSQYFKSHFLVDSLTVLWFDKDNLLPQLPKPCDKDYHIRKPSEKEFLDTCNEFWWVSTYVAKGLLRKQIIYAKEMLETVVRPMFMKVIGWKIGADNNFSVSIGMAGKQVESYISPALYKRILNTYSNFGIDENWKSLFVMTEIFAEISAELAQKLNFRINKEEQENATAYLKQRFAEQRDF